MWRLLVKIFYDNIPAMAGPFVEATLRRFGRVGTLASPLVSKTSLPERAVQVRLLSLPLMFTLRKRDDKLFLCRDGKEIAAFTDPEDEDTANTVCNVLNAEEQRWPPASVIRPEQDRCGAR